MKKILFVSIIVFCATTLSLTALTTTSKLKFTYHTPSSRDAQPQSCPPAVAAYSEKFITIENGIVTFTECKQTACDFSVEEVVETIMGAIYCRIIYQDTWVLVWDDITQQFKLISKDERINPLKEQIKWRIPCLTNLFFCKTMWTFGSNIHISLALR